MYDEGTKRAADRQISMRGPSASFVDPLLFGQDPTEGIVSVAADRSGQAIVWRRVGGALVQETDRFNNWFLTSTLDCLSPFKRSFPTVSIAEAARTEFDDPFVVVHLAGEQHYRYLVLTKSFNEVERVVVASCNQGNNRAGRSLFDLRGVVYCRPPVEQYLTITGRTYFKGLSFDDPHRLQFDLETGGLSPDQAGIFMIAVRDNRGFEKVLDTERMSEAELLRAFVALLRERDPDILENHNIFDFDLRFLLRRAAKLGIRLPLGRDGSEFVEYTDSLKVGENSESFTRYELAGREIIDTLHAMKRYGAIVRDLRSRGLKEAAKHFGFARKDREYVPGHLTWRTFQRDPQRVRRYAFHDVEEVDFLSRILLGSSFALASMVPKPYEKVATSGTGQGLIEPLMVRAYVTAGHSLPKGGARGEFAGGFTGLFTSGVVNHVVKADVASLYPSIMLLDRIAPSADQLGAFLQLLGGLTDLRLQHKRLAREHPTGSKEQSFHDAFQSGLKILINSFYGSLGTSIALFGDPEAAGRVTQRGREVLLRMLREFEKRGLRLVEADTDGVLLGTPERWDLADELGAIAEVNRLMPEGIRIEHDGRYQAIYSYAEKNYVLLDYQDQIKVVGVAFKSSRSERYAEHFYREVFPYLLRGDLSSVRRIYLETVRQLRQHELPVEDLCVRVQLTKTPEAYHLKKRTEEQYQVLLAAGREHWRVGERVAYYQALDGSKRLLSPGAKDYDAAYYVKRLRATYVERLARAFQPEDFAALFSEQLGMFDRDPTEMRFICQVERALNADQLLSAPEPV